MCACCESVENTLKSWPLDYLGAHSFLCQPLIRFVGIRIAIVDKDMWGGGVYEGDWLGLWTANGNGGNARGGVLSLGGKLMGKIYSTSKQGCIPIFGNFNHGSTILQHSDVSVPPDDNDLKARSSHVATFVSAHPNLALSDQAFDTPQRLVSGLTDLRFQKLSGFLCT
ncbi:hypothetical protein Tco_0491959 [Tanacetum coccineum]